MARDSARQGTEVELKLEFNPADAARIASHPRQLGGLIASLLAVEDTQPTMPAAI